MSALIVRVVVWLVILGFVTAGLTVCAAPAPLLPPPTGVEVGVQPLPTPQTEPTDTLEPPSPTP